MTIFRDLITDQCVVQPLTSPCFIAGRCQQRIGTTTASQISFPLYLRDDHNSPLGRRFRRGCPKIDSSADESRTSKTRCTSQLWSGRRSSGDQENQDDDDPIEGSLNRLVSIFNYPTPGITPPLAFGYALILLASPIILPATTSVLFVVLFGMFSYIGRTVILSEEMVEDDEERPPVDLLSLAAAVVTAGIVSPFQGAESTFSGGSSTQLLQLGGFILLASVAAFLSGSSAHESTESQELEDESMERELMDLWDRDLQKKSDENDGPIS